MAQVRARQVFTPMPGVGQQAAVLAVPRLDRFAGRVVPNARSRVNVRSGELRDSIGHTPARAVGTQARTEVFARAKHAIYVELGSRPHEIRPRRAKALRFTIGTRVVFAKRVWHPGTAPTRFLSGAVNEELSRGI